MRYGEIDGSEIRPIAPRFREIFIGAWAQKNSWAAVAGSANTLQSVASPFGGAMGFSQIDSRFNYTHCYSRAATLSQNESLAFRAFVHPVEGPRVGNTVSDVKGHFWGVRIVSETQSGRGVAFQLRDGRPEILRLSKSWTRGAEQTLLYRLENPTPAEETQIQNLEKSLYSEVHSLSFENSSGRDAWIGESVFLAMIPDPAGNLHLAMNAADVSAVSLPSLGKNPLWDNGAAVEVYASGGAWIFQPLGVRFGAVARMEFGPFQNGYWADSWGQGQFTSQALANRKTDGTVAATVTFSRETIGETAFRFVADFATTDNRHAAWLYGLSARLPNGPRSGIGETDVSFDSEELESDAVLGAQFNGNTSGRRTATVTLRDVQGAAILTAAGASIDAFVGRVCDVSVSTRRSEEAAPFLSAFRQGMISRATLHEARQFGGLAHLHSQAQTTFDLEISDGWALLDEMLCDPAPVLDGLRLGAALRLLLGMAGYSAAEIAGVPANTLPTIERAPAGAAWANVPDSGSSIGSAIDALLDCYGLGLRFYQNTDGVWVLERVPSAIVAAFTSNPAQNDPMEMHGGTRNVIFEGLSWERDHADFYNVFRVVGGANGEITREWRDRHSMILGNGGVAHPRWLGREKRYPTLEDSGLLSDGAVNYALRSLVFRYGKPGRICNFESNFVRVFAPWDRITADGVTCEVLDWSADSAADRMQIRAREIV